MGLNVTILPVVTNDLPISHRFTPYEFLSRCKFSTLTNHQPMVAFYLTRVLTLSATEERKKIWFDKSLTHDFRTTSRCTGYQLDHSGGEGICMVTHIASVRIF